MSLKFPWRRRTPDWSAPPSVPKGQRIYAIGDIHGRIDLLEALLIQIEEDDFNRPPAETSLIFLGDLIDRGPDSSAVVERLRLLHAREPRVRFLLGNHEEVFLSALEDNEGALRFFHRIGGDATIISYGVPEEDYARADFPEILTWLRRAIPEEHVAFLRSFEDMIVIGDYAFVHAGIHPEAPLDRQSPKDLRWIRAPFLNHAGPFDKVIVHGHTISKAVEQLPYRIGLDTGAFASGNLSAMGFEGTERWILDTR